MFNTGTVSWVYRCLIEGLFGLKGDREGLVISPQLPSHWNQAKVIRQFRGATFDIEIRRQPGLSRVVVTAGSREYSQDLPCIIPATGNHTRVKVTIPDMAR